KVSKCRHHPSSTIRRHLRHRPTRCRCFEGAQQAQECNRRPSRWNFAAGKPTRFLGHLKSRNSEPKAREVGTPAAATATVVDVVVQAPGDRQTAPIRELRGYSNTDSGVQPQLNV